MYSFDLRLFLITWIFCHEQIDEPAVQPVTAAMVRLPVRFLKISMAVEEEYDIVRCRKHTQVHARDEEGGRCRQ